MRDSVPADSITSGTPVRLPVTAEVLRTAFRTAGARELFLRARRARIVQDSSLRSYDAKVTQRMSVWMRARVVGRERLAFRRESAARVRWERGAGAHVDITGSRVSAPILGSQDVERRASQNDADDSEVSPVPYFPGTETLWFGGTSARADVNERSIVHPLAVGAEAYYTYRLGDSVSFQLPDGRAVQLRELDVRPRTPSFNLGIGSMWFEAEGGQLVRAAFRLAAPARGGVSISAGDSAPLAARIASTVVSRMFPPMSVHVSAVTIEYGLHDGRFWLPRVQTMEGTMEASIANVTLRYENIATYTSVDAPLGLTVVTVDTSAAARDWPRLGVPPSGLDTADARRWRDSARTAYNAQVKARADSVTKGLRVGSLRQCDSSAVRAVTQQRYEGSLAVVVRVPCDTDKLMNSPDLPASAFESGETVFNSSERQQLVDEALSMAAQAPLFSSLPRPRFHYGLSNSRYNRVEGISTGVGIDQQVGGGYSLIALGRFSFADQLGGWEFAVVRSNVLRTVRVNGYNRLVSAGDWGTPLSFGASVSGLLFGLDEGFYYRASGAEVTWNSGRDNRFDWRLFAERQRNAPRTSTRAAFTENLLGDRLALAGAAMRMTRSIGVDPTRARLFTDIRLEGAGGDSAYGRGAMDLTLSRPLLTKVDGAITVSSGTSVGGLPAQRQWFLGGTYSVRGQSPDTAQHGNAFWLGRVELGRPLPGVRFALFGDIGWVGDRTKIGDVGRPLSGAGAGISGFDGLMRLDVARGLHPRQQFRVSFYLDAKF